ncbi:MAG: rhomboid family intramembrane serine protease [Cypionkella sp.]|nr:rhomboid family intramembrane serine protease [Cypionkella sp.]
MHPDDPQMEPPFNPLPWVIWVMVLPMVALEAVFSAAEAGLIGGAQGIGWRVSALEQYAVWPAYWRQQWTAGALDFELLLRFVAYPFLHINVTHAVFAVVILLAMGKFVGDVFRPIALAAVYFISAAIGALIYASIPAIDVPLMGAYPGDYGLIGAFTFLLWVKLAGTGANQLRAFTMIGFLLGVQLVFGLLFGGGPEWVADVTAFVAGFALSFVAVPGGWQRVRARLRQR